MDHIKLGLDDSLIEAAKNIIENKNNKLDEAAKVDTKKYSWGTMKTVHHGSSFSIPLHPEHHQAISKLKDGQNHKFKDETGQNWVASRKGDTVHFNANGMKTHVLHSSLKEEVENLDELSKKTLSSYVKKASSDAANKGIDHGVKKAERDEMDRNLNRHMSYDDKDKIHGIMKTTIKDVESPREKAKKRLYGITKAVDKLAKEEVELNLEDFTLEEIEDFMMSEDFEQLDELSKKTLGNYVKKASRDAESNAFSSGGADDRGNDKSAGIYRKLARKRLSGISKAVDKLAKEEYEQLDELSKTTLGNYVKKATDSVQDQSFKSGNTFAKSKKSGDYESKKSTEHEDKSMKRVSGIRKAINRLTKEEVELNLEDFTLEEIEDFMMSEDFEQLDELSKKTLGNYVKKANKQIKKNDSTMEKWIERKVDNSKLHKGNPYDHDDQTSKRKEGVAKASTKLAKEDFEQLDELSKKTLGSYIHKAAGQMGLYAVDHGRHGDEQKKKEGKFTSLNKALKRLGGIQKASKKLSQEQYDEIEALAAKHGLTGE